MMAKDTATTNLRLQHYSYINPDFSDEALSTQSSNSNNWKEFLRKPITDDDDEAINTIEREEIDPVIYIDLPEILEENKTNNNVNKINEVSRQDNVNEPVIYGNVLQTSSAIRRTIPKMVDKNEEPAKKEDLTKDTVIYVDLPECSTSFSREQHENVVDASHPKIFINMPDSEDHNVQIQRITQTIEEPPEIIPEVYIDLAETSNNVNTYSSLDSEGDSLDTIFYDPFENRIITPKEFASPSTSMSTDSTKPIRPAPPLPYTPENHNPVRMPVANDGFELSPIPINEYPEPPPPYTEFQYQDDHRMEFHQQSQVTTVAPSIMPCNMTHSAASSERKQVICQHCGCRVRTLVLKQAGAATHVIALSFLLFCLLPCTFIVYCVNWFKYKNHYCPTCSHLIGYEVPVLCQKLVFVAPKNVRGVSSLTTQI